MFTHGIEMWLKACIKTMPKADKGQFTGTVGVYTESSEIMMKWRTAKITF